MKDPHLKYKRSLQSVFGYFGLNMPEEAERELDALPAEAQTRPEVISLRTQVLLMKAEWKHAATLAAAGHSLYPEVPDFYVQQALAFEQLGEPARAISMWQASPVRDSGFCHFNLARCEMQLGNIQAAGEHMRKAMQLEPDLCRELKENQFPQHPTPKKI